MANATIDLEKINEATFQDLKKLVLEQARHHSTQYTGDDKKFIEALKSKNAVPQILMVRDDDTQEALGYILFNHYYGLKGQELYMEDILVSDTTRSQGFGLAMMEELKAIGRELGVNSISWTVAENNPSAIRFYENKVRATPLDYTVYDCSDLFKKPPAAPADCPADYEVRRVDKGDLDLMESYVGRLPSLTKEKMENIRAAASAENAAVYIALGNDGTPKAVGITNANYSSFRTVYGYKLEMMELVAKDEADASTAFKALTCHVIEAGKKIGYTGHLNICIDKKSPGQKIFMKDLGSSPLQMTDEPGSVMLLYGLGRDNIYAPKPQNVVNSAPIPKAPGQ
jgi:ribosomal protein S18 acetylase RimI-like enzyme